MISVLAFAFIGTLATNLSGQPAQTDFALRDRSGRLHEIKAYRGSVVLLHFWGSWCGTCVEEIPDLERLNQMFRTEPFLIVAPASDESWAPVPPQDSFLVLLDPKREVAKAFGVTAYPNNFLLDHEGKVGANFDGPLARHSDLVRKIQQLIAAIPRRTGGL